MKRPVVILLSGVAVVLALAVAAYAFRSRLAEAPIVGAMFQQLGGGDEEVAYWTCPMHPHIKEHGPGKCPECGMDLVAVTKAEAASRQAGPAASPSADGDAMPTAPRPDADPRAEIQIDLRRQQLIGVRTAPVERARAVKTVRTIGLVRYDETRLADVNLKLEGWIEDLYVDYTGKLVRTGEPLFTIYSPELLTTQNEYLLALKTREQVQGSQIRDAREYADRLVDSARQRLALWDLPPDQMKALEERREAQTKVLFRSPVNGFVIEKQAFKGLHVMPGQSLFKIADLSVVWIEADVYEQEAPFLRVGARATVTLDAYPGEQFAGRAVYVYPFVEEKTRTVRVRFAFPNRGGRMKPGMYANVELRAPLGMSTTIPANALLDSGSRQLVFVAEGDGYFQPRDVKVGQRLGDRVQILDGLKEGEMVAMGATFFLDSESQLRASVGAFEPAPAMAEGGGAARQRLDITFRSEPDPPRTGDTTFEVAVRDAEGQPITDADVSVTFFMAAMPTMNMPAMRNETKLPPVGGGTYRGIGQVMMGGRWDVTVSVSKDGQRLGSSQFAVVAR